MRAKNPQKATHTRYVARIKRTNTTKHDHGRATATAATTAVRENPDGGDFAHAERFYADASIHNTKVSDFIESQTINNTKVDTFIKSQTIHNTKVDNFIEFQETHNETVDGKLDSLLRSNPQALVDSCLRHVVVVGSSACVVEAPRNGGTSTWSFLLGPNGQFMAISAAHCIDTHSAVKGDGSIAFMSIPRSLVGLVIGVGLRDEHVFGKQSTSIPFGHDIAFLLLKELPGGVNAQDLPTWGISTAINEQDLEGVAVGGKSVSRNVHGTSCAGYKDGKSFTFVCDSGEPGNSGTVMHALRMDGPKTPFGVFLGLRYAAEGIERGMICPFSDLGRFQVHKLVDTKESSFQVLANNMTRLPHKSIAKLDNRLQNGFCMTPRSLHGVHGVLIHKDKFVQM